MNDGLGESDSLNIALGTQKELIHMFRKHEDQEANLDFKSDSTNIRFMLAAQIRPVLF